MVEQSCDNISYIVEIPNLEGVPHIVEGRDLETLIVASIQTLKRNNKKRGKEEVLRLVQESIDSEVTKEHFEELLQSCAKSFGKTPKSVKFAVVFETASTSPQSMLSGWVFWSCRLNLTEH